NGNTVSGGVVNTSVVIIRTVAPANTIVRLYRDGVPQGEGLGGGNVDIPVNLSQLGDGVYHFTATVEDFTGNVSASSPTLTLTLSTTPPTVTGFGLAAASQTGGPGVTTLGTVTLVGQTGPGDQVVLTNTNGIVVAGPSGQFQFVNVSLAYGRTDFTVQVT